MKNIAIIVTAATILSGCGSSSSSTSTDDTSAPSPTTDGAFVSSGTYSVIQDGTTFTLPDSASNFNGQATWLDETYRAGSYTGTDVLAIGGLTGDESFSGITGETETPTGSASYDGRYTVVTDTSYRNTPVTFEYDLATSTFSLDNTSGADTMVIEATVTGDTMTGTATYNGVEADLEGGFYTGGQTAGAFDGDNLAGVFYGTEND